MNYRVLWPVTVIAIRSGHPALTMFLTAGRSIPNRPASVRQAVAQTLRKFKQLWSWVKW